MTVYHYNRLAALCILLTVILAKSSLTSSSECRIEYVIQPLSAPVNCSPYSVSNISNNSVLVVTLECAVRRGNNGSTDEFEIRWFRENTSGGIEELGRGSTEVVCENTVRSRYHDRELLNQQFSPSLLGKYWCQVINTTTDQPLMRSNVFTLLAPGDYNGTTCPTVQAMANTTCADLPASPLASFSTPSFSTSPLASISTTSISMSPLTSISLAIITKPVFLPHNTLTAASSSCITITIPGPMPSFTPIPHQLTSTPMPSITTQLPRPPNPATDSAIIPAIVGVGVASMFVIVIATVTVIIIVKVCSKKKKEDEEDYMTMSNIRGRVQSSTRSEPNPYDVCYFDNTIPESSSITTQTNHSFRNNDTPPPPSLPAPAPAQGEDTRSQGSVEYANMDSRSQENVEYTNMDSRSQNSEEYASIRSVAKENGKILQSKEESEYQNMPSIEYSDQESSSQYQALDISTREYVSIYTKAARKLKTLSEADGYGTL